MEYKIEHLFFSKSSLLIIHKIWINVQLFRMFYALSLELALLAIKLPGWSASSVIFSALAFSPISNFSFENKIVGTASSLFTPAQDLNGTVIRIHNSIY